MRPSCAWWGSLRSTHPTIFLPSRWNAVLPPRVRAAGPTRKTTPSLVAAAAPNGIPSGRGDKRDTRPRGFRRRGLPAGRSAAIGSGPRRGRRPRGQVHPPPLPARPAHNAKTNGSPVQRRHSSPRSQENSTPRPAGRNPRSPMSITASVGQSAAAAPWEAAATQAADANARRAKSHQGLASPRSFVQRQAADLFQGDAAVEHDAPHRAVAGDAAVGDDRAAGAAEVFDRRNQGDVERPSAKPLASRLGRSTSIVALGASRARQKVSGQAFRWT